MGRPGLALLLALAGCSIQGTRQQGDTCLSSRECASGLLCEVTPSGPSRCVLPTVLDAAPADGPPTAPPDAPDAPPADAPSADASPDAPTPDAPIDAAPTDSPRDAAPDSTPPDTTAPDSTPPDTTAPDSAPLDTTASDTVTPTDVRDAGAVDGAVDA
ncbi:MAG: hypothetical protein HY909_10590 [Deltaproteobacteria bacterium]|nr:hypothetical protein [Deltaproteobacteria bacterium]